MNNIETISFSLKGAVTQILNSPEEKVVKVFLNTESMEIKLNKKSELKLGDVIEVDFKIPLSGKLKPKTTYYKERGILKEKKNA
jgi:hypothetical protein